MIKNVCYLTVLVVWSHLGDVKKFNMRQYLIPVIVYCAAGGRSPRAAAAMVKLGFTQVFDYAGGMNDWKRKGKKTVN